MINGTQPPVAPLPFPAPRAGTSTAPATAIPNILIENPAAR